MAEDEKAITAEEEDAAAEESAVAIVPANEVAILGLNCKTRRWRLMGIMYPFPISLTLSTTARRSAYTCDARYSPGLVPVHTLKARKKLLSSA